MDGLAGNDHSPLTIANCRSPIGDCQWRIANWRFPIDLEFGISNLESGVRNQESGIGGHAAKKRLSTERTETTQKILLIFSLNFVASGVSFLCSFL